MDRASIEALLSDIYSRTPGKGMTPDERRDGLIAMLAGIFDAGGLGSGALDAVGAEDAAKAVRDAKGANEGAAGMGEVSNPLSAIPTVYEGVRDLFKDDVAKPTLKSRDEFFQERRKPVRSVGEVRAEARDRAMNSPAYLKAIEDGRRTTAEQIAKRAADDAESALGKDAANAGASETQIGQDYEAYRKDYDRELESYYGRSFADRNPEFAKALPIIGTVGAGLLTRGLLGRMAGKTAETAQEVVAARKAGNPERLALARTAAEQAHPSGKKIAGAYAAGAAVPVEAQMLADLVDKKGLPDKYQDSSGDWKDVLARARASERLDPINHFGKFAEANATALISGAVGAATGGKLARPMTPVPARTTPAAMQESVDDILAGINARKQVEAARAPSPGPNNTPPGPSVPVGPAAPGPGPTAPTANLPARQSQPQRQPSAGPSYASGSPDQLSVQKIIDDLLGQGQSVTDPAALTAAVRSAGAAPTLNTANLTRRATGTANEAKSLEALGINLSDPAIRQAIIQKIAPGTAGMLGVGGMANGDLDALLAEIMAGGGR
jgi:hypothetical protein